MVARRPLVLVAGVPAELPSGDTVAGGGGGLSAVSYDCDFGNPGAAAKTFDITDAAALAVSSRVLTWLSGAMPGTLQSDELELDPLQVSGSVPTDGTVQIAIASITGSTITGKRRIHYALA